MVSASPGPAPLAQGIYRLSDGGYSNPPRLCAGRRRGDYAFHYLHSAYLGVDWVGKWLDLRERLVEIAKVLQRFPWMVEVVRQRPMTILHPYAMEVYVTRDGSGACLSLNPPNAFCARDGSVREVRLELEFKRYEVYEEKMREVYRPKGLLAFTTAAREYVRIL
jgi:hypothetical protein